mgnify:CR=1 FL=1
MALVNEHFLKLANNYLFADIAKKVNAYKIAHPKQRVISLGIGDVTQPLCPAVIKAMHKAVDEMAEQASFRGYGPERGYDFLREAIIKNDFLPRGIHLDANEVFVNDGAKSDTGNITELFAKDNVVLVPDPVYPVYVDTNTMDGKNIIYMNGTKENDFLPMPDENVKADIIYLCSPNNPTGACYNKEQLEAWVAYALKNDAVILYDSAYEAFITDPTLPRSIYAIEGAKKCAIEFCSLSKTAGFTGTRFSYTVVPEELVFETSNGGTLSLHNMWNRRQCTKFNGTPYIIQYAGAKVFTEEGMKECQENIGYYRENARMIAETLEKKGISFTGGVNSPYIWFECPKGMESWEFFDYLLENAQVVGTPGAGFGENGKNYFRLTSFGKHEKTKEAMERFNSLF